MKAFKNNSKYLKRTSNATGDLKEFKTIFKILNVFKSQSFLLKKML